MNQNKQIIKTGSFKPIPGRILILGSRATLKSLKRGMFYTSTLPNTGNLIWQILDYSLFDGEPRFCNLVTEYISCFDTLGASDKKTTKLKDDIVALLNATGIGLSDVIVECESKTSLDNDIHNAVINPDIEELVADSEIVILNGSKAYSEFNKLMRKGVISSKTNYVQASSTSMMSGKYVQPPEKRKEEWKKIIDKYK